MTDKPLSTNSTHFSTENFPEVIGFCDRDDSTHVVSGDEESYHYKLQGRLVYLVKRKNERWEIIEFNEEKPVKVSTGKNLGMVLVHALTFTGLGANQEVRTNVLIPVHTEHKDKAIVMMYYLGGYPGSFFEMTPEIIIIKEKFIGPEIEFLSYSYVPVEYVPWLREELKKAEIIGQDQKRSLWVYKK